jgi:hypothetical protein
MVSTPDRINFGKVTEQSLSAAWDGDDYSNFRERLDSENPPQICQSCSLYWGTF